MTGPDPSAGPEREFDRRWAELVPVGRNADSGGYRRFAWTRADHTLREWFAAACADLGLDLTTDRAGNQWAWWGDPDAAPGQGVAVGSHLDSVPDGGAYDGPLGVVSALVAVRTLQARGFRPARPVAVVNFVDEEGARFGVACAGSRLITGALTADRALALTDVDGVSLAEARRAAGAGLDVGPDPETLRRLGCFVELHVEQGRALADLDPATSAVALGTDIWPHGRWRVEFAGEANHAGTTRLADRRDALLAAAEFVTATRRTAEREGCVATVGRLEVTPNGINAVPAHVRSWLDARGPDADAVTRTVRLLSAEAARLGGTVAEESATPSTPFDPALTARLRQTLGGEAVPVLGTGAGHDAGILANAGLSTAMLFVRNPTGVSHSPAEFAEATDCHAGVAALTAVVADLAGPGDESPGR